MVIQNISSFLGLSSNKFPKDFIELINNLEMHQEINEETFKIIYDAYQFVKKIIKTKNENQVNHILFIV